MIFTVAIDGPAAAGKGTIARAVAEHFGFVYLDTGLLYRAAARKVIDGMDPVAAAKALSPHDFERAGLRTAKVGQAASKIAALPKVRAALVEFQHKFARSEGGAVLDGRDIGTVICPEAEVKLFITASDAVRAVRRHAELVEKSVDLTVAEVLADLQARDARDTERKVAPLLAAVDAVMLDTSEMTIAEAVAAAIEVVEQKLEDEFSSINGLVSAWNERGHAGQFVQKRGVRDRADVELSVALGWARAAAEALSVVVEDIVCGPHPNDPPDCNGRVGEREVSIELTELVDSAVLSSASQAHKPPRLAAKKAKAGQAQTANASSSRRDLGFADTQWTEARFREKVSKLLANKTARAQKFGRDFDYVVIYSGEPWLHAEMIRSWLTNGSFPKADGVLNAHFLLDYEPGGTDHWPVFDLYNDN